MIRTATQLKEKVRNLSGGDSTKAQTLMQTQWESFKTDSFFVGELSWEDVMESVKELAEAVL